MDLSKIHREELQDIISQCEQALYNHQQWYNLIIRSLICKLPHDRQDIIDDAHKECRFGQVINIDDSKTITTSVSIGLSSIEPDCLIDESIEHADSALYKAKSEGKNCTRLWDSSE